jgi:tetratricopeptide (TPR) repeat protein
MHKRARIFGYVVAMLAGFLVSTPAAHSADAATREQWLAAGVQFYQAGDIQKASEYFSAVLQEEPENPTANYYLGAVFYKAGNLDKAIEYTEKAATAPTPPEGSDLFLASLYSQSGKKEKALEIYSKLHEKNPDNADITLQYATLLADTGNEGKAIGICRKIIDAGGPSADPARNQLALLLMRQGFYRTAESLFEEVPPESAYYPTAKQYADALGPTTRPFSLFLSLSYFYNDNPDSSAVSLIPGQFSTKGSEGSNGYDLLASLNTASYEFSDAWRARFGYLYYGTFYTADFAKKDNFVGHFAKPHVDYTLSSKSIVGLDPHAEIFYYSSQKLSTSYGADISYDYTTDGGDKWGVFAGYSAERYTKNFRAEGATFTSSMQYKDTDNYTVGLRSTLIAPQNAGALALTAKYKEGVTRYDDDKYFANKSRDYRHRAYAATADLTIPFSGWAEGLSFQGGVDFSYRDYLNKQSGELYPSSIGKKIDVVNLTFRGKLEYPVWNPAGIRVGIGLERNESDSEADELMYDANKYYFQVSGSY